MQGMAEKSKHENTAKTGDLSLKNPSVSLPKGAGAIKGIDEIIFDESGKWDSRIFGSLAFLSHQ